MTRIVWPDTLATEFAEHRCIVFMGAGASMKSVGADGVTHPPGWPAFLKKGISLITKPVDHKFASKMLRSNRFLDAAEIISECSDRADFADYVRNTFVQPRFSPSEMHKLILELDPKIVITTNYDKIYDQYCVSGEARSGYNVALYTDHHIVENIRSRIRLVLKAHGCVSHPQDIVLSRSSYYKARRDHPAFYAVLDALFLTNTIMFVGCSLNDPDIQLVLENVNLSAPSLHPHYALIEKTQHRAIKAAIKMTHNIELIEYPRSDHEAALKALRELKDKVIALRSI